MGIFTCFGNGSDIGGCSPVYYEPTAIFHVSLCGRAQTGSLEQAEAVCKTAGLRHRSDDSSTSSGHSTQFSEEKSASKRRSTISDDRESGHCSDSDANDTDGISNDLEVEEQEEDYEDVEIADLKTVATLGVGGFGRVNLVKHFDSEKVFALKILNKAHVKEMNQQEHVLNERDILTSCKSDFIVRLYKTYRDPERLYMLLEYCPGGEVWTMLRNWGRFDEVTSRYYCAAALEAFDYLHRRFIIYRDLKPENMLLDKNGFPKLADFGFAKQLKTEGARTWTFCGTAEYVAPEIILNKGQDTAVDIWSLGIFMYELISGSPPFASTDPMHTYNSILKGVQMLSWPRFMTETAKALICKFCRRDPTQRLGYGRIEDARRDPWFNGFDFVAFRNHTMRAPIRPKVRSLTDTQNFDRYPSTDNFATGVDESGWDSNF
ncbi:protein kinase domain-containing protein [Ditylenchus destructor]|uniref:Protein kinase domain-containing protein n=1 Tax=Ditylenchus destructor TaxID=166010 RepID=A0AAD4N815_9BILA|nr:protein kinase domain-containing protein [Ditylenchus destructor]